jgi:hypothetical protein
LTLRDHARTIPRHDDLLSMAGAEGGMAEFEELTGGVDAWSMLVGSVSMVTIFAGLTTWPVCALLFWRYRRAVDAGMRTSTSRTSSEQTESRDTGSPAVPRLLRRIPLVEVGLDVRPPLLLRARRAARRAQVAFGVAGVLFGLSSTAVHFAVEGLDWAPVRTVSLVLILGWLVVPSVFAQGVVPRRAQVGCYAGYLGVVVVLSMLGGTSLIDSLLLLLVVVLIPGAFVLATGLPALRGAAWLVAPVLALGALAGLALFPVALHVYYRAPITGVVWSLLGFALLLLGLCVVYGFGLAALYTRKWTSDRTLLVLQWWFVLALVQVLLLSTQGASAAALALIPPTVLVVSLVGAALLRRAAGPPAVRLLLLRTFGARQRSTRLLRDVTAQWRWIGSVELITGTDVATEVLEPHEFLDFLRRRLASHFVADVDQVPKRVQDLDLLPDRDGRFRVNDLLCHTDTWQPMVQALLDDVDAVLVDLRGLMADNGGVLTEIEYLVASVPLQKVVAVLDDSTDLGVLQRVLDRASAAVPASSPLHADPSPALRVVPVSGRRREDVTRVLSAVARAAEGPRSAQPALGGAALTQVPHGRSSVPDRPHATTEG